MDLTAFAIQIFEDNKKKGFWDEKRNVGEMLMLVVSELGEAIEARRKGRMCKEQKSMELFALNVKDTFEDEIADAIIRLLDMCGGLEIDIHWHVFAKLEYNKTRERLHGKKY
ncbi:MAG: hypothetical protein E6Q68_01735 [Polynucleobacter sp.]|nr:MAG: hypothetical protein E6Q68_01735 [Polynucleobacter sp.]